MQTATEPTPYSTMRDIIVTTPQTASESAAREAEEARACIEEGGESWYFRHLGRGRPRDLEEGGRVYYVEGGFIWGFATVAAITQDPGMVCDTTGREFGPGWYAVMDAQSWRWIDPIWWGKGFQGWRYADGYINPAFPPRPVGGWRDPRPEAPAVPLSA